jgi:hypothetical protein
MELMSWQLIVADAIVVWRMIVLYQSKVVRIGILFLLFSFGSELQSASPPFYTDRFFPALALFNSIGEPINGPFERALVLSTVASFLSFGINLIATSAISWKAWCASSDSQFATVLTTPQDVSAKIPKVLDGHSVLKRRQQCSPASH